MVARLFLHPNYHIFPCIRDPFAFEIGGLIQLSTGVHYSVINFFPEFLLKIDGVSYTLENTAN